ncbi:unnamed protein product [Schistosoma curassoni]|uniref:Uncharacterized protein n=1 Tax=Schistosoma curassoni TaxID=6186 RepID=A0A3P8DPZ8_9TREM|nr:unnamed protein product [Schistosoma curassoni]
MLYIYIYCFYFLLSADDSNGGGGRGASFTPTKARCGHLLVNHDLEVKKLAVPHVKEKFNLISTNNIYNNNNNNNNNGNGNRNNTIQAQFPTVCQLLCETNSCSHTPVLTKANMPNAIVNQQNHPIGGGYNEVIARTTLCVAALCLIAFNPAQITNQAYMNTGGTSPKGGWWLGVEFRTPVSSYLGLVSWMYLHPRVDVHTGTRMLFYYSVLFSFLAFFRISWINL